LRQANSAPVASRIDTAHAISALAMTTSSIDRWSTAKVSRDLRDVATLTVN
jgi:hypothetical protein